MPLLSLLSLTCLNHLNKMQSDVFKQEKKWFANLNSPNGVFEICLSFGYPYFLYLTKG